MEGDRLNIPRSIVMKKVYLSMAQRMKGVDWVRANRDQIDGKWDRVKLAQELGKVLKADVPVSTAVGVAKTAPVRLVKKKYVRKDKGLKRGPQKNGEQVRMSLVTIVRAIQKLYDEIGLELPAEWIRM
jgi:hypothetical protein